MRSRKIEPLMTVQKSKKILKESLRRLDIESIEQYNSNLTKDKKSHTKLIGETTKVSLVKHRSFQKIRPLVILNEEKRSEIKYKNLTNDELIKLMIKKKLVMKKSIEKTINEKENKKNFKKNEEKPLLAKDLSENKKTRKNSIVKNKIKLPHII